MNTKSQKFLLAYGLILFNSFSALAADQFHIVKTGEIFSRIARQHFGYPTYSEAGAVKKLKSLNPEIKNIEQLIPGQKLRLSNSSSKESPMGDQPEAVESASPRAPLIVIREAKGDIAPTFRFVTLNTVEKSSNTHTNILSKYYVEVPATFEQKYHAKMSLFERISLANAMFSGLQGDSSRDQKFFLWGAALGVKYSDFHRFDFFGELGFDPMLYAKDVTRTSFKMVTINLPNAKFGVQRVMLDFQNFSFGARANVVSYFSGSNPSFTVKPGYGFGGGLYLRKTYSTSAWGVDFGADKIYQNTSLFQQTRTDVKGMLKYELKFF